MCQRTRRRQANGQQTPKTSGCSPFHPSEFMVHYFLPFHTSFYSYSCSFVTVVFAVAIAASEVTACDI